MNFVLKIIIPLLTLFFPVHVQASPYIILEGANLGMFAIFNMVLSLCQAYECQVVEGGQVSLSSRGVYYSAQHGENWWEYYFEPICFGKVGEVSRRCFISCDHIENYNSRVDNFNIIEKYIHLKAHILLKLNEFLDSEFRGYYIIGVHYRGTDKEKEAERVSYEKAGLAIQQYIASQKNEKWKVFVATDEKGFLDYLSKLFPGKVCFNSKAVRSEDNRPLHYFHPCPYQAGEDALLDCLLLSKSDIIIRTSSNLSLVSSFFNPGIPVISLNDRYNTAKPKQELKSLKKTDPALYGL